MLPSDSTVTLRRDLSAVAQEYDEKNAQANFIGDRVCPPFPVGEAAAEYPIFLRSSFKKPEDVKRAEGGAYNRFNGTFGKGTYSCEEHGLEYPIDDRRRARYASFFDAEAAAVRITRLQLLLARERRIADLTLNNASFTQNAASGVWSTSASAVPLTDLVAGIETLEDKSGVDRMALSLIMPRQDQREFMATAQVIDKMKYTFPGVQPALLSALQIAAMLGIREVLTPRSVYDATEEGYAEGNTQIWTAGKVMLAALAPSSGAPLEMPALARTFMWTRGAADLPIIETYRDERVRSDIVRVRDDTDEALTGEYDLFGYVLVT